MDLINSIKRWWSGAERKESRITTVLGLGLGQPIWTPRDYADLAKAGYQQNSDVFTAVNLIMGAAKQIPLFVTRKEGGEAVQARDTARDDSPEALARLIRKPNPRASQSEMIEAAIGFILLSGNRYIERVQGGRGTDPKAPPIELWWPRPDRMRIVKGPASNPIQGFQWTGPIGRKAEWEPWEILHQKTFNPLDDWYGMAPAEAAGYPIDISNESAALYKKLLQKGYPAGWVEPDGDWGDEQIKDFKRGLEARSRENSWLFGAGIKGMHPIGFNPENARIVEGKLASKRDIGAVYRVPPEMLGDTASKTYSNFQEARRSLYTEAALPELVFLVNGLNSWLSPLFRGAWINIDRDKIDALSEDRNTTAKRANEIFMSGLVKRNEARAEMGFEAVPDKENVYYHELPRAQAPGAAIVDQGNNSRRRRADDDEDDDKHVRPLELKAFNLDSEEAKDEFWKAFDRQRGDFYDRYAKQFAERFDDERRVVLLAYRESREAAALRAVDRQHEDWLKIYTELYQEVAPSFGRRVLATFKHDVFIDVDVKAAIDIFTRTLLNWLATEGAKRVVGVTEATKKQIGIELATGVANGESIFELSKRLESMYLQFKDYRAERVARTEIISASNLGSHIAAKSTNLPLEKEWIATFDNRTRSPHAASHGQKRAIDTPFDVKGERLMWPGDSSLGASADNIVMCRCTTSYRVKRS